MSSARFSARRQRTGPAMRAWVTQHLQCAVASLGSLWRAPLGTTLTVTVVGVALALPLAFYLLVLELHAVSARFGASFDLTAFLRIDVDEGPASALADALHRRDEVAEVRVIGRKEGLAELRAAAGLTADAGGLGGESPLPVVLVVSPVSQDRKALDHLTRVLAGRPEVESVLADRAWLDRLEAVLGVARRVLWVFTGLIGAGVALVIGNTLRLTVEARRAEVEIVKLFGASDAFVRRPFLYQGLLYGLGGGAVGYTVVAAATLLLNEPLARLGREYALEVAAPVPGGPHLVALLACGAALGLLGAWLSVARQLRAVQPR
jgi:cell division transport system permease protein